MVYKSSRRTYCRFLKIKQLHLQTIAHLTGFLGRKFSFIFRLALLNQPCYYELNKNEKNNENKNILKFVFKFKFKINKVLPISPCNK